MRAFGRPHERRLSSMPRCRPMDSSSRCPPILGARFMGVDDSPSILPPAPQRGEGQLAFPHLTVGQTHPCCNEERRQPEVLAERLIGRFAEVLLDPGCLALVPPLPLSFSKGIPAVNDFTINDKGKRRIPGKCSQMAIRVVCIGRCFHLGKQRCDLLLESSAFK